MALARWRPPGAVRRRRRGSASRPGLHTAGGERSGVEGAAHTGGSAGRQGWGSSSPEEKGKKKIRGRKEP